jgi:hypothetical protein
VALDAGTDLTRLVVAINDSGAIGVTVGTVLGWVSSWYFYRKSRGDSEKLIDVLRSDNAVLKDYIATAMTPSLSKEGDEKIKRIRATIHSLDKPVDRFLNIVSFGIPGLIWLALAILLIANNAAPVIFLLLFPGFLPFLLIAGITYTITHRVIVNKRVRIIDSGLRQAHLNTVETDHLKRWVSGHAWEYFRPAWLLRELETRYGHQDAA